MNRLVAKVSGQPLNTMSTSLKLSSCLFASLVFGYDNQSAEENGDRHSLLVYYLLKRKGKIALQMEAVQMKIVFNMFELISPKIINPGKVSSQIGDVQGYTYQLLLPLYKVCEGYAGKVIPGGF
ncbi:hypothetical protein RHGRI_007922 [Rhododendron griersonianum]|uniref:Uncharacterized protein n=1 Tax=Rhododendron griersonianum TaxID=479676 RepID=A0AAV6KYR7_9ERIC|nr:hypothetical protein RHGRI_007922 [Rhododendron griersonianum]